MKWIRTHHLSCNGRYGQSLCLKRRRQQKLVKGINICSQKSMLHNDFCLNPANQKKSPLRNDIDTWSRMGSAHSHSNTQKYSESRLYQIQRWGIYHQQGGKPSSIESQSQLDPLKVSSPEVDLSKDSGPVSAQLEEGGQVILDELLKINLGCEDEPNLTFINRNMSLEERKFIQTLWRKIGMFLPGYR